MSDRSEIVMDPLSEVLALLKLRSYMSGTFRAGGDWSIAFKQHDGIKFQAIVHGECWVRVEGVPEDTRVAAGDCVLLPRGRAFRICSDLDLVPHDFVAPAAGTAGGIGSYNGGDDFLSIGGYFTLAGEHARMLLELLPPIVYIRSESEKSSLRWCLERLKDEYQHPQAGSSLVAHQLASLMLLQALRLHMAATARGGCGWLSALADKHLSAAIRAMHADPAHRWTLNSLADVAGMSRTAFAVKFKKTVGVSVMEYLTRWRMLLAGDRLVRADQTISAIAASLGYESESSFGAAFKKTMGVSPRRYGRLRSPSSVGTPRST